MTFLNAGLFAAGALCVSIPIIIHLLLRQRRKPIRWGAMRFLLEAYKKQRRKLKIQQLILLLTRCLIVLLLAMAIGRPLLSGAGLLGGVGGQTVFVLIDNSMASSARDLSAQQDGETALDRHKRAATAMLRGLGIGDQAGLVAMGGPAQPLVTPASSDISAVIRLINDLTPTDSAADIRGSLEAVASELGAEDASESGASVVALFSDYLLGSVDVSKPLPASLQDIPNLRLVASNPAPTAPVNVQVVGIEPIHSVVLTGGASSGRSARESVRVFLRRSGPIASESRVTSVRMRVSGGDSTRDKPGVQGVAHWNAGETEAVVRLQIDPTVASGGDDLSSSVLIAEIDRDAVAGDNTFRRPIGLRESLRIGVIGRRRFGSIGAMLDQFGPADWIRLALKPSPAAPIDIVDIDPSSIDAPTLASLNVVYATTPELIADDDWARLATFAESGGLLVVTPAAGLEDVQVWSDAMVRELGLGWRVARQATVLERGAIDNRPGESPILQLLRNEVADLVEGVVIERVLPIEEFASPPDVLLRLEDGTPWLVAAQPNVVIGSNNRDEPSADLAPGRGLVIYMASAPTIGWTNLQWTSLMVPLVQEVSQQGYGLAVGEWSSTAGRRASTPARTARLVARGANTESARELDVTGDALTTSAARRAGLWEALDEAGRSRGFVAINADPEAGRMVVQDSDRVRQWILGATGLEQASDLSGDTFRFIDAEDPGSVLALQNAESPISFPLLVAAFAFAFFELFMARWFSHGFVERPGNSRQGHNVGATA